MIKFGCDTCVFGLSIRHTDAGDYNAHINNNYGSPQAGIEYVNYQNGTDHLSASPQFNPGSGWHTYRFEVKGDQLTFKIDGAQISTVTDNRFMTGRIAGLWSSDTQLNVRRVAVYAQ